MKTEKKTFPYLEPTKEASFSKKPHITTEESSIEIYKERGSTFDGIDKADFYYRFERTKVHFTERSGKNISQNVTLSKPSGDVICLRKNEDEKVEVCLLLQRRSPYQTYAGGKTYVRNFWEHVGGMNEKGETLEQTAIREAEEETGYRVLEIHKLIAPIICKHVSYADESTEMYWAIMGGKIGQKLDNEEQIHAIWKTLNEVETEFEAYMDGGKKTFFGFDMPEMTMLGFQRLFVKYHRGDIL